MEEHIIIGSIILLHESNGKILPITIRKHLTPSTHLNYSKNWRRRMATDQYLITLKEVFDNIRENRSGEDFLAIEETLTQFATIIDNAYII
jgi:hypothetical protein